MNIKEEMEALKKDFGLSIPNEYQSFIEKTDMFDYSDAVLNVCGEEIDMGIFLKVDEDEISRDLLHWYALSRDGREEYLTIATGLMGGEIALKVKGDDLGKVYFMDKNEKGYSISKLFDTFKQMKKYLEDSKNEN